MTKVTPTTPKSEKKFWEGTDFYVVLGLVITSASSAFMEESQAQITWLVEGIFAGLYLIRQLATGKFSFSEFKINNGWNYVLQLVVLVAPQFAEAVPALRDLVDAFINQNWPAVISGLLSLGTILYYILTRPQNKAEFKKLAGAKVDQ